MGFMSGRKQEKKAEETYIPPRTTTNSTPATKTPVNTEPPTSSGGGSYIGRSLNIKADITSDEDVTIEGRVEGNITVSKTLTIGKNGNVAADMKAAVVRIIGTAKGNIDASTKVEILSEGRYTGNLKAEKLVVADGAVLNGYVNENK